MIVDVHNHFYPKAYLDTVKTGKCNARAERDASGNLLVVYEGDYNVVEPGHHDVAYRMAEIAKAGIHCQVLSLTTPGVHIEEPGRGVEMARACNEGFAQIVRKGDGPFEALAALPLQEPESAAAELRYAVRQLGAKGGLSSLTSTAGTSMSRNTRFSSGQPPN